MFGFNKTAKETKPPRNITFQKVYPVFVTVDGVSHTGTKYKWCNVSGITCSAGEYAMISIVEDGYLKDENKIMYPLNNIISIDWITDKQKVCIDTMNARESFQVWFSDDDVAKFNMS